MVNNMKNYILAFRLMRRNLLPQVIVTIQIIGMALAFVVLFNITQLSSAAIDVFEQGDYRTILCMNPILGADTVIFRENAIRIAKQSQWYRGTSSLGWSFCLNSNEAFVTGGNEEESAEIITMNDFAINGFHFPVAAGRSLVEGESHMEGEIPCVIGGKYANRYKTGDLFTGYVLTDGGSFADAEEILAAPKEKITLKIVGKLTRPEQMINIMSDMSWSMEMPASMLLENYYDRPLFAIVPEHLYPYVKYETPMLYIFFDKEIPEIELHSLGEQLGGAFAKTDTELIATEEIELNNNEDLLRPFTGLMLLTCIAGVFSLCLLSTVKNTKILSIYNLLGCSSARTLRIVTISAITHVLLSLLMFIVIINIISHYNVLNIVGYYFLLTPRTTIIIILLSMTIILTAFFSGFLAIKRQSTVTMLLEGKD